MSNLTTGTSMPKPEISLANLIDRLDSAAAQYEDQCDRILQVRSTLGGVPTVAEEEVEDAGAGQLGILERLIGRVDRCNQRLTHSVIQLGKSLGVAPDKE